MRNGQKAHSTDEVIGLGERTKTSRNNLLQKSSIMHYCLFYLLGYTLSSIYANLTLPT